MSARTAALVPGDWARTSDAEAAVVVPAGEVGCTHFAGGRVVVTVTGREASDGHALATAHENAVSGRAFAFPGQEALEADGVLSAADVVSGSAVDAVVALGGGDVPPDARIDVMGFARPLYRAGRLELVVRPSDGGVLVPFERREQIPCCADHG